MKAESCNRPSSWSRLIAAKGLNCDRLVSRPASLFSILLVSEDLPRKIVIEPSDLSDRRFVAGRGDVRKVPPGLLYRAQAVTDQESLVHEETEIVGLQLHPPCRLAVQ